MTTRAGWPPGLGWPSTARPAARDAPGRLRLVRPAAGARRRRPGAFRRCRAT